MSEESKPAAANSGNKSADNKDKPKSNKRRNRGRGRGRNRSKDGAKPEGEGGGEKSEKKESDGNNKKRRSRGRNRNRGRNKSEGNKSEANKGGERSDAPKKDDARKKETKTADATDSGSRNRDRDSLDRRARRPEPSASGSDAIKSPPAPTRKKRPEPVIDFSRSIAWNEERGATKGNRFAKSDEKPQSKSKRKKRKKKSSADIIKAGIVLDPIAPELEQVIAAFAACQRCGFFLSSYRARLGFDHFEDIAMNQEDGWLILDWSRMMPELVSKTWGTRWETELLQMDLACPVCQRVLIYKAGEDGKEDTAQVQVFTKTRELEEEGEKEETG